MLQSPNELEPRAALLQHYNVVKQHTEQSKSRVSCKGCSHTFAGKTTRMAAHYMQTAGESVSLCKSPPEGATDAATAHFSALEKKRVTTKKRKVDNDAIDSKQLSIWKMLDGKGHDSANAAFARMVFAHGLSFNIGTSKYLLGVMEEARKGHRLCKKNKTRLHGSCASFSHTVVETQVSSKKGLCVHQREVNDAAMVLHSVYKARMFM